MISVEVEEFCKILLDVYVMVLKKIIDGVKWDLYINVEVNYRFVKNVI